MKTRFVDNFATVKTIKADGTLSAVASTGRMDRDGEIVLPGAFLARLDSYRRNPVVLAAHVHRSADGSPTIIGSASKVEVKDGALRFDMAFASTTAGREWKKLFDEGHARAFSIGFIPIEGAFDEQRGAYVHTEVELLEISAVAVPANPDAVRRGVDLEAGTTQADSGPVVDGTELADEMEPLFDQLDAVADGPELRSVISGLRGRTLIGYEAVYFTDLRDKMRRDVDKKSERALVESVETLVKSAGDGSRTGGRARKSHLAGVSRMGD